MIYPGEPPVRNSHELYIGSYTSTMPKLVAGGRISASIADIMRLRVNSEKNPEKYDPVKYDYIDTGDMLAIHPNGMVKVVRDAQMLREMTQKTKIHDGSLVLEDGIMKI